jgi:tetratricopeptide (TPR) repeat protein
MSQSARNFPVTAGIGLAALAMALTLGLIQHQRSAARADFIYAEPLVVMPVATRNESDIRDRDIEFYTKRIREDKRSAADHVILAGVLFTRSRNTGSTVDLDSALQLARESVAERSRRNDQAFSLLASLLMAKHEFREARTVAQAIDSIDPGNPSHLALLGEIELELGDYQAAASHFGAINYDGRNFTNAARLARWYEVTGHNDKARQFL